MKNLPLFFQGSLLKISILQLDLLESEWIEISELSPAGVKEVMSIYSAWNGALTVYIQPTSPVSIVYYDVPQVANRTAVYSISYTELAGWLDYSWFYTESKFFISQIAN